LGYRGIYNLIKDLGEVAGIENCHPHRLRHTFATRLVLKGVDSYLARKLTRHKSESAFRRYSEHARQQAAEEAFHAAFGD
jgi:integrase/recombinase XerD